MNQGTPPYQRTGRIQGPQDCRSRWASRNCLRLRAWRPLTAPWQRACRESPIWLSPASVLSARASPKCSQFNLPHQSSSTSLRICARAPIYQPHAPSATRTGPSRLITHHTQSHTPLHPTRASPIPHSWAPSTPPRPTSASAISVHIVLSLRVKRSLTPGARHCQARNECHTVTREHAIDSTWSATDSGLVCGDRVPAVSPRLTSPRRALTLTLERCMQA